jgi:N-acetylglucosamine kinase-like BadF-type ATPase
LLPRILELWELADLPALVERVHEQPGPDLPPLTPLVVECAAVGDEVAQEVLRAQGDALGAVVLRLLRRARLGNEVRVAFAGSIVEHVMPVREALIAAVHKEWPQAEFLSGVVDPVQGALWRARTS